MIAKLAQNSAANAKNRIFGAIFTFGSEPRTDANLTMPHGAAWRSKLGSWSDERAERARQRELIVEQHTAIGNSALLAIAASYGRNVVERDGRQLLTPKRLYALLNRFYAYIADWREQSIEGSVIRRLRSNAPVIIEIASTSYLVLIRAALPDLPAKKASKWAAALDAAEYHEVPPRKLEAFLKRFGGIEGAARERARLWATVEDGEWARRSPFRNVSLSPTEVSPHSRGRARSRSRIGAPRRRRSRRAVQGQEG